MKKLLLLLSVTAIGIIGCTGETQIAAKSDIAMMGGPPGETGSVEVGLNGLQIGSVDFGNVDYGETTAYMVIEPGTHTVTATGFTVTMTGGGDTETMIVTAAEMEQEAGVSPSDFLDTVTVIEGEKNLITFTILGGATTIQD